MNTLPFWIEEAVQRDIDQTKSLMLKQPEDLARYEKVIADERIERVIELGTWTGESANWFAERVPEVITVDVTQPAGEFRPNVDFIHKDALSAYFGISSFCYAHRRRTLVSLDDAHNAHHVAAELERYSQLDGLVYLVVEDTIHHWRKEFAGDDPLVALRYWMAGRGDFVTDPDDGLTLNPFGWLRKL